MNLLNPFIVGTRGQYDTQGELLEVPGDKGIKINEGTEGISYKIRPKTL